MTSVADVSVVEASGDRTVQAGRYERRGGLLLLLTDVDGTVGVGEASPLFGYSPDTREETARALSELTPALVNQALLGIESGPVVARLTALSRLLASSLPAAGFALETAYLDLACRQAGSQVGLLLPALQAGPCSVAALLPRLDESSIDLARGLVAEGYSTLKIKLSGRANELDILSEIAVPSLKLRVDANRALDRVELPSMARRLGDLGVEFIEEPCRACTVSDLGETSLRLALDETLQGVQPADLDQLLDESGARVIVVKPMVLGGFVKCLALADVARRRGVHVVVSHSFDGPVALHAASLLALSIQSRELAAGLAPHDGLELWPAAPGPFAAPGVLDAERFARPWLSPHEVLGARR